MYIECNIFRFSTSFLPSPPPPFAGDRRHLHGFLGSDGGTRRSRRKSNGQKAEAGKEGRQNSRHHHGHLHRLLAPLLHVVSFIF